MKNLKLVIFDLDGVLVDACEWHRIALNEALKDVCDYEISHEDHERIFNGIPTRVKLEKLTEMGKIPKSCHEEIYQIKQKKTVQIIKSRSKIRSEKIEMIESLKRNRGLTVCCFTNSIRKTADLMLKTSGVFDLLDMIVTNQDVKNPKPNPEGYLKILSHFNISPTDAIIVEDSPKGIEAAILSGCKVIGVSGADQVTLEIFEEFLE
jgi:HAD superfamily hydrolase (TIGR01509 family)